MTEPGKKVEVGLAEAPAQSFEHAKPGRNIFALQAAEALRRLQDDGVLTGRTDKISARIDEGLMEAAARKLATDNTTEIVEAALALFTAQDPFVEWLLSDRDRLPADFELAI
jgi:hypothetical protein